MEFVHRCWAAVRRHPWRLLWLLLLPPLAIALYVFLLVPQAPTAQDIRTVREQQASVLMSDDGQVLATFRRTNREWVKLSEVSPKVLDALIATEDRRFFEHGGLDLRRTIGAAFNTLRGDLQGGSTISQQLARNMFPEDIGRAPTIERKVKEAVTALRLEHLYSKDEILEMYLNTVPFLYNAYGIEMAARTYFDKSAGELDTIQAATLIGMLKGTRYYNPVLNPERAVQRRNIVLAQLVKHGKLQPADYESMKGQPLGLDFERQEEDLGAAPHVAQQLKRWLISWADKRGYNIYADGLVVRTTLDSRLQQIAVDALTKEADKLQALSDKTWSQRARAKHLPPELAKDKPRIEAAFYAQDPSNGHIKAWVGSRDFRVDQFDHVQQAKRQPGSTFKPFVYGAAFDMGIGPNELFIDQPVEIQVDAKTTWKPGDVHDATYQPMTLRDGLIHSKNSITAQLVQRVGAHRVAQVAQAMGVKQSKLDEVPSLALGTSPVTLKEMVSAYSTIADTGRYVEPVLVLRIEDRKGHVIEDFHPRGSEQALPVQSTQTLLDVMRGVVDRGTGAAIRSRYNIQGDLAGKTGTTQDNTDGWFILMHPQLVAGAWVGFNDARITMGDAWGQGARNALLIVGNFMQQTTRAKIVDTKMKFNAPRDNSQPDPDALARMQEIASGLQPNPVVPVTEAASAPPVPSQPVIVIAPTTPDFNWTPQRQRSTQYQDSAGFAPPPRVELGAGPAYRPSLEPQPMPPSQYQQPAPQPSQPAPGPGIPILRSY
ncbi:MAG TPA: transglycosylase domain-containing protein [Ramlibacter sp.]|nr:transglycosylase domain-containing protein [Ramlibacter sp.]